MDFQLDQALIDRVVEEDKFIDAKYTCRNSKNWLQKNATEQLLSWNAFPLIVLRRFEKLQPDFFFHQLTMLALRSYNDLDTFKLCFFSSFPQ
jgi:hypothetical protein